MTSLARRRHSQSKNPASLIPSTIIIIPLMKRMVLQLMPVFISLTVMWPVYQKVVSAMLSRLSAFHTSGRLCMASRKTTTRVSTPATRVTKYRGNFSRTISTNMTTKIITAKI